MSKITETVKQEIQAGNDSIRKCAKLADDYLKLKNNFTAFSLDLENQFLKADSPSKRQILFAIVKSEMYLNLVEQVK